MQLRGLQKALRTLREPTQRDTKDTKVQAYLVCPLCPLYPLCQPRRVPAHEFQIPASVQAFHRNNQRSNRETPALTINTTTPSTVMPANTPVVSKVPSAWEMT
jgi:hypothetical protein